MTKKTYSLQLSKKGCEDFIQRLNSFKNDFLEQKDIIIKECLEYIKKESKEWLKVENTFEPDFYERDIFSDENCFIEVKNGKGKLIYNGQVAVFAEFGTGITGEKHTNHPLANEGIKYMYNSGSKINENGYWTWKVPNEYRDENPTLPPYITFTGYTGKKFVYRAVMDFINRNVCEEKFEQCMNKLLNKYF